MKEIEPTLIVVQNNAVRTNNIATKIDDMQQNIK